MTLELTFTKVDRFKQVTVHNNRSIRTKVDVVLRYVGIITQL